MTDLLLVGAGHGHLHVLTRAAELVAAGYRVRLLAPRSFDYSGVASATAAGELDPDAGRIDVRALARAAGVEHHEDTLASLDPDRRTATAGDGTRLTYDVLSLNLGSVVAPSGVTVDPSVLRVKPLSGLADLDARLDSRAAASAPTAAPTSGATVTVVGGGATGLELAAHLSVRRDVGLVRLVEAGPHVGADLPRRARRRLERLLAERGVDVRVGCAVREVGAHHLWCADGTDLPHDLALLATGLSAPPLLAESGLVGASGSSQDGVPVRATLQHAERDEVYAVGDCARFLPTTLARVGVHGVRQGPVLHRSLLARASGEPLPTYEPPRVALSVLDLGDGVGLAVRGRWWWYGAAALRLKRRIDRRWLATYQDAGRHAAGRDPATHRVPPT